MGSQIVWEGLPLNRFGVAMVVSVKFMVAQGSVLIRFGVANTVVCG